MRVTGEPRHAAIAAVPLRSPAPTYTPDRVPLVRGGVVVVVVVVVVVGGGLEVGVDVVVVGVVVTGLLDRWVECALADATNPRTSATTATAVRQTSFDMSLHWGFVLQLHVHRREAST